MKIKDRIALYFTLISTSLLFAVLCTVYFIFMKFLQADFFERLTDRTMVTAELYLEADEISRDALNAVRHKYLKKLNGEVTRIYDRNNKATFIGDTTQYWTDKTIDLVRKKGSIRYTEGQRQVVGISYKDNQGDFVILAAASDHSSATRLQKLQKIMGGTFLLISLIVLVSSRWIAGKMLLPLNIFTKEVQKIGTQNMASRVATTNNKDEINQIAKSFNILMEELEQAFILQKTFVANASHELRTPVTRVMMTSELALSKQRDAEAYKTVLQSILDDAEKMDFMITALLTLAKMDLEVTNTQLTPVDLNKLLLDTQHNWQQERQLSLNYTNPASITATVLASTTLLQMAIDNILSNAFKFSGNKPVECVLLEQEHNYLISIKDKGIGIAAQDEEAIFKPFYSRSKEAGQQGEGMGLYLTKKIIEIFKGSIEIAKNEDQGSVFTIYLSKL